jgi:hypothetical protein
VERLDAEKVGVELDDLPLDRTIWDESNVLIGNKEQQAVGTKEKSRGVGPKRAGAGLDEIDGEVIGAGRVAGLAVEPQTLGSNRPTAPARIL